VRQLNNDIEAQKKIDTEAFEADVKNVAATLPNHTQKEYAFTRQEQQMLAEQQTIVALGERMQLRVINEMSLKRVDVVPTPETNVRYHIGLGKFVVFVPKDKAGEILEAN
jgi:hypothetical protein